MMVLEELQMVLQVVLVTVHPVVLAQYLQGLVGRTLAGVLPISGLVALVDREAVAGEAGQEVPHGEGHGGVVGDEGQHPAARPVQHGVVEVAPVQAPQLRLVNVRRDKALPVSVRHALSRLPVGTAQHLAARNLRAKEGESAYLVATVHLPLPLERLCPQVVHFPQHHRASSAPHSLRQLAHLALLLA
jgi:hypothetical protein